MFVIISQWLRGLIIGWILSLVFLIIKRALKRAFEVQRAPQHPHQQPQPSQHNDVIETIWAGMTTAQLQTTFGAPLRKEVGRNGDIWIYAHLNGHGTETAITIQNGIITSWQNMVVQNKAISS